ncbi:hypothetical protein HPB47_026854 [Ixodes persulcatus]|uniref:Uncharacterized protein n=1 Tax=Ixodes persulcatus TaxID=34615 RepID=A0AC60PZA9_IXOPE|nr:hypothetical protein HPB47_026854 [Ixodes persulcatus]
MCLSTEMVRADCVLPPGEKAVSRDSSGGRQRVRDGRDGLRVWPVSSELHVDEGRSSSDRGGPRSSSLPRVVSSPQVVVWRAARRTAMSQLPVLLWTLLSSVREDVCYLPPELRAEIRGYRPLVHSILSEFVAGAESGSTYADLAYFADRFGHRVVGSASLEDAIDHLVSVLRHAGMDHVAAEPVPTPVWSRGPEKATVVSPRLLEMDVLGLGGSVSTPPAGITARVVVVESFVELQKRRERGQCRASNSTLSA